MIDLITILTLLTIILFIKITQENGKMYKSEYITKDNLFIEIINHNNHIIIKDDNYNKGCYIGYNLNQAIIKFKNEYKQENKK